MRSEDFFAACDRTYGYIYIDGNHSYEGVRRDLESACRCLDDGGLIALHDVAVTEPGFGAGRAVAELDPVHFGKVEIPIWPGLALVQPRSGASGS